MNNETKEQIEELVNGNSIMLFMKGYPNNPMCGFSAKVAYILTHLNISFESFNVLEDQDIREGIKEYGNWPTIPQLYANGELIGGCDIIIELAQKGELKKELGLD
jgi:monothiol glutaredoxin